MGKQVYSDRSLKTRGVFQIISISEKAPALAWNGVNMYECPLARGLSGGSSGTDTMAAQGCIQDQLPLKLAEYFGHIVHFGSVRKMLYWPCFIKMMFLSEWPLVLVKVCARFCHHLFAAVHHLLLSSALLSALWMIRYFQW